jgi:hypothetical protein
VRAGEEEMTASEEEVRTSEEEVRASEEGVRAGQEMMRVGQEMIEAAISTGREEMRATINAGQEEVEAAISAIRSVQAKFEEPMNKLVERILTSVDQRIHSLFEDIDSQIKVTKTRRMPEEGGEQERAGNVSRTADCKPLYILLNSYR